MQKVSGKEAEHLTPAPGVTITEYPMGVQVMSGALAEISDRYPEEGFAVNDVSDELVYVIHGTGNLHTRDGHAEFTSGDVLFIPHGEAFWWRGDFTIFMVTAPEFDPARHRITE